MTQTGDYKKSNDRYAEARERRFATIDKELAVGSSVDAIARELGVKRDSIARQATRHGRPDLAAKFATR